MNFLVRTSASSRCRTRGNELLRRPAVDAEPGGQIGAAALPEGDVPHQPTQRNTEPVAGDPPVLAELVIMREVTLYAQPQSCHFVHDHDTRGR